MVDLSDDVVSERSGCRITDMLGSNETNTASRPDSSDDLLLSYDSPDPFTRVLSQASSCSDLLLNYREL